MSTSSRPCALRWIAAALAAGGAVGACSHAATNDPAAATGRRPLRLIVTTAADWPDAAALGRHAASLAGVPVPGAAALGPRRFALTLSCTPLDECDEAERRLLADRSGISDVQPDARRSLPPAPPASTAR